MKQWINLSIFGNSGTPHLWGACPVRLGVLGDSGIAHLVHVCASVMRKFVPTGRDRSSWEWALIVSPGKIARLSPSVLINWLAGRQSCETWLRVFWDCKGEILPVWAQWMLHEKGLSPTLCSCPTQHWGSPQMKFPHHDLSVLNQFCNEHATCEHPKEWVWLLFLHSDSVTLL